LLSGVEFAIMTCAPSAGMVGIAQKDIKRIMNTPKLRCIVMKVRVNIEFRWIKCRIAAGSVTGIVVGHVGIKLLKRFLKK